MNKRYIWIPVVLWLITLAAFVGVAVLFIDKIDTVHTVVAADGGEAVGYFGPHMRSPFGSVFMVFFGLMIAGFFIHMLFKPFIHYRRWNHHPYKHFGYGGRPPWWGGPEDEADEDAKEKSDG